MKTAILVSGQMRTADVCSGNQYLRVKRHCGDVGLYLHAADDEDAHKTKIYSALRVVVEKQPQMDEKNYQEKMGLGCYGVQVVLRQLWAMQRVWRIMEASDIQFDWVVRLRPDCWFHNDLEDLAECDPACLYVPTFHNFFGLNDRFAFGGYEVMKVYMNRLDNMDEYIAAGGIFHPESHLKWTMERAGIKVKRTQILFDLVRKTGEHVKPQWNHDCYYGDVTKCS